MNKPKKHHYVPRFYLRNFCCNDDKNKVPAVSLNFPYLITKPCSISGIGYEDNLYKITNKIIEVCIEEKLNREIETPISQSETWKKILSGKPELLDENDKFIIYIFMRHLQSRNVENLAFIRSEQERIKNPIYRNEYTPEEHSMYSEMSSLPQGANHFYFQMAENVAWYAEEYKRATISILGSTIPIRTSTDPVLEVPASLFPNSNIGPNEFVKWLPLTPKYGAMLFLTDTYNDFSGHHIIEPKSIKFLNQMYLVQLLKSKTTRHMIANDDYIMEDFKWSGIQQNSLNPNKFKVPQAEPSNA